MDLISLIVGEKVMSWIKGPESPKQTSKMAKNKLKGDDDDDDTNKNVNYTTGAGRGGREMAKAVAATTTGGASLILSGVSFSGTVIALAVATPLLVIFSPVIVPAVITVFLLLTGVLASGGFTVAASAVFTWLYKIIKGGEHDHPSGPSGPDLLYRVSHALGSKAERMSDRRDDGTTGGGDYYTTKNVDHSTRGGDNYTTVVEGVQKLAIAASATTIGGPLLGLAGLVLARMVGEISMALPLILVFSPLMVPALATLLSTSGGGIGGVSKAAAATTIGGSFIVLSGWTFARSVFELVVATPLLVLFSPVLVPAVITAFLLANGFLASGGFGVAGMTVLVWLYRYVTGGHPAGAESCDQGTDKLGLKGGDKGRAQGRAWD